MKDMLATVGWMKRTRGGYLRVNGQTSAWGPVLNEPQSSSIINWERGSSRIDGGVCVGRSEVSCRSPVGGGGVESEEGGIRNRRCN